MPSIRETFRIEGNAPVTVLFTIGDAQIGGFSTFHNGAKIAPVSVDETKARYELGAGSAVRFTDVSTQAFVKDVSKLTDHTSLSVAITQGNRTSTYSMEKVAPTDGTVDYSIALWFE
ncbi:MAG TPA: hypothetical protein VHP33_27410 [Polyangiaceae bacterium]|nr:hypothetical protein [Polyangiaceae bacterium]